MENNNVFGLEYSECDTIITNLTSAIGKAQTDLEYINYAYLHVSGCRNIAKDAVGNSLAGIKSIIEDISKFKDDFSDYYENVKEFDEEFFKSLSQIAGLLGDTSNILTTQEFGYLSTGKDGLLGTLKNIYLTGYLAKHDHCYILEKNGYCIIKGTAKYREGIESLKDIKAPRYAIGSKSYYKAGLDKYIPKGSSFEEGVSKFKANIKPNIKKAFNITKDTTIKSGLEDFGKNTFIPKENEGLGNIAKGLGIAAIGAGIAKSVYDNYQSDADAGEYAGDAVSAAVSGAVGMAAGSAGAEIGFAIGTAIPIPVVGSLAGAALGFVGGYVGGVVANELLNEVDIGGQPISGWISTGVDIGVDTLASGGKNILDSVKSIF